VQWILGFTNSAAGATFISTQTQLDTSDDTTRRCSDVMTIKH